MASELILLSEYRADFWAALGLPVPPDEKTQPTPQQIDTFVAANPKHPQSAWFLRQRDQLKPKGLGAFFGRLTDAVQTVMRAPEIRTAPTVLWQITFDYRGEMPIQRYVFLQFGDLVISVFSQEEGGTEIEMLPRLQVQEMLEWRRRYPGPLNTSRARLFIDWLKGFHGVAVPQMATLMNSQPVLFKAGENLGESEVHLRLTSEMADRFRERILLPPAELEALQKKNSTVETTYQIPESDVAPPPQTIFKQPTLVANLKIDKVEVWVLSFQGIHVGVTANKGRMDRAEFFYIPPEKVPAVYVLTAMGRQVKHPYEEQIKKYLFDLLTYHRMGSLETRGDSKGALVLGSDKLQDTERVKTSTLRFFDLPLHKIQDQGWMARGQLIAAVEDEAQKRGLGVIEWAQAVMSVHKQDWVEGNDVAVESIPENKSGQVGYRQPADLSTDDLGRHPYREGDLTKLGYVDYDPVQVAAWMDGLKPGNRQGEKHNLRVTQNFSGQKTKYVLLVMTAPNTDKKKVRSGLLVYKKEQGRADVQVALLTFHHPDYRHLSDAKAANLSFSVLERLIYHDVLYAPNGESNHVFMHPVLGNVPAVMRPSGEPFFALITTLPGYEEFFSGEAGPAAVNADPGPPLQETLLQNKPSEPGTYLLSSATGGLVFTVEAGKDSPARTLRIFKFSGIQVLVVKAAGGSPELYVVPARNKKKFSEAFAGFMIRLTNHKSKNLPSTISLRRVQADDLLAQVLPLMWGPQTQDEQARQVLGCLSLEERGRKSLLRIQHDGTVLEAIGYEGDSGRLLRFYKGGQTVLLADVEAMQSLKDPSSPHSQVSPFTKPWFDAIPADHPRVFFVLNKKGEKKKFVLFQSQPVDTFVCLMTVDESGRILLAHGLGHPYEGPLTDAYESIVQALATKNKIVVSPLDRDLILGLQWVLLSTLLKDKNPKGRDVIEGEELVFKNLISTDGRTGLDVRLSVADTSPVPQKPFPLLSVGWFWHLAPTDPGVFFVGGKKFYWMGSKSDAHLVLTMGPDDQLVLGWLDAQLNRDVLHRIVQTQRPGESRSLGKKPNKFFLGDDGGALVVCLGPEIREDTISRFVPVPELDQTVPYGLMRCERTERGLILYKEGATVLFEPWPKEPSKWSEEWLDSSMSDKHPAAFFMPRELGGETKVFFVQYHNASTPGPALLIKIPGAQWVLCFLTDAFRDHYAVISKLLSDPATRHQKKTYFGPPVTPETLKGFIMLSELLDGKDGRWTVDGDVVASADEMLFIPDKPFENGVARMKHSGSPRAEVQSTPPPPPEPTPLEKAQKKLADLSRMREQPLHLEVTDWSKQIFIAAQKPFTIGIRVDYENAAGIEKPKSLGAFRDQARSGIRYTLKIRWGKDSSPVPYTVATAGDKFILTPPADFAHTGKVYLKFLPGGGKAFATFEIEKGSALQKFLDESCYGAPFENVGDDLNACEAAVAAREEILRNPREPLWVNDVGAGPRTSASGAPGAVSSANDRARPDNHRPAKTIRSAGEQQRDGQPQGVAPTITERSFSLPIPNTPVTLRFKDRAEDGVMVTRVLDQVVIGQFEILLDGRPFQTGADLFGRVVTLNIFREISSPEKGWEEFVIRLDAGQTPPLTAVTRHDVTTFSSVSKSWDLTATPFTLRIAQVAPPRGMIQREACLLLSPAWAAAAGLPQTIKAESIGADGEIITFEVPGLGPVEYRVKMSEGSPVEAFREPSTVLFSLELKSMPYLTALTDHGEQVFDIVVKGTPTQPRYFVAEKSLQKLLVWCGIWGHDLKCSDPATWHVEIIDNGGEAVLNSVRLHGNLCGLSQISLEDKGMGHLRDALYGPELRAAPSDGDPQGLSLVDWTPVSIGTKKDAADLLHFKSGEPLVTAAATTRMIADAAYFTMIGNEVKSGLRFVEGSPYYYDLQGTLSGTVLRLPVIWDPFQPGGRVWRLDASRPLRVYHVGWDPDTALTVTDRRLVADASGGINIFYLESGSGNESSIKRWQIEEVSDEAGPLFFGAANVVTPDHGEMPRRERFAVLDAAESLNRRAVAAVLKEREITSPSFHFQKPELQVSGRNVRLRFKSQDLSKPHWAVLSGVQWDPKRKRVLFEDTVTLEVRDQTSTGPVLQCFDLLPVASPHNEAGVYHLVEVGRGEKLHHFVFEWFVEQGILGLRQELAKPVTPDEFQRLLADNHIPQLRADEWQSFSSRHRLSRNLSKVHVDTRLPVLPLADRGFGHPDPDKIETLKADDPRLEKLLDGINGTFLLPEEDTVMSQVMGGRERELFIFYSRDVIIQIPMLISGFSYVAHKKTNPFSGLENVRLLLRDPERAGYWFDVPAPVHSHRSIASLPTLRFLLGKNQIPFTFVFNSTTVTLTGRKAAGLHALSGDPEDQTFHSRDKSRLADYLEVLNIDKEGIPLRAVGFKFGEPIVLPDGRRLNLKIIKTASAEVPFDVEGYDFVSSPGSVEDVAIVKFEKLNRHGGQVYTGFMQMYRAPNGDATFYLRENSVILRLKLNDDGEPLFWRRDGGIGEFPLALHAEFPMRGLRRQYQSQASSTAIRISLKDSPGTFEIVASLGRQLGASQTAAMVQGGSKAFIKFRIGLNADGSLQIPKEGFVKQEGKGKLWEKAQVKVLEDSSGRLFVYVRGYEMRDGGFRDFAWLEFETRKHLLGESVFKPAQAHYNRTNAAKFQVMPGEAGFLLPSAEGVVDEVDLVDDVDGEPEVDEAFAWAEPALSASELEDLWREVRNPVAVASPALGSTWKVEKLEAKPFDWAKKPAGPPPSETLKNAYSAFVALFDESTLPGDWKRTLIEALSGLQAFGDPLALKLIERMIEGKIGDTSILMLAQCLAALGKRNDRVKIAAFIRPSLEESWAFEWGTTVGRKADQIKKAESFALFWWDLPAGHIKSNFGNLFEEFLIADEETDLDAEALAGFENIKLTRISPKVKTSSRKKGGSGPVAGPVVLPASAPAPVKGGRGPKAMKALGAADVLTGGAKFYVGQTKLISPIGPIRPIGLIKIFRPVRHPLFFTKPMAHFWR